MDITDITSTWLENALGSTSVLDHRVDNIGEGLGFGGAVYRVSLTWDEPGAGPSSIIVKLPVKHEATRRMLDLTGVFFREARFY